MATRRAKARSGETPPTAYGYCRISLDRLESVSVEAQEQAIRAYHAHRLPGLPLVIVSDKGISGGTRLFSRPGGRQLEQLDSGDHVIVTKVDRAFRSIADGAATIDLFQRRNVGVHCLDVNIDTTTPTGRAMLHMLMTFAQLERERISERRREAAAFRRARGECMHCPHCPPLGWRVVGKGADRRYVPDQADRKRCDQIRSCHDEGNGYRKIVMIAAREGWKTRLGTPWSKTQVRKAIRASRANYPTVSDRAEPYQIELPRRTQAKLRKSQYRRGADSRRKPQKSRKRKR